MEFSPNIAGLAKASSGEDAALSWFPIVPGPEGITFDNEITGQAPTMAEIFRTQNGVESVDIFVLCHTVNKEKLPIRQPTFHYRCAAFSRAIDVLR